jgi:arsenate reductase
MRLSSGVFMAAKRWDTHNVPRLNRRNCEERMIIYGLKNCDTCRKAVKALPEASLQDVREAPVPGDTLSAALATFGDALMNTRSTTWRNLPEGERGGAPLDLIRRHPALMKRPLIDAGGTLYLGWGKDVQAALDQS